MPKKTKPAKGLALRRSDCPIACTLDLIGDRWTLLIVRDLLFGRHRFSQFLTAGEGFTTNILADRLRRMEQAGIIRRVRYQDRPPRDEYHLTERGRTLGPILNAMARWGATQVEGTRGHLDPEIRSS